MEPKSTGHRDALPPISRYELLVKIASGGMATVYVGRSRGPSGITRLFAIKRAHAHLADDPVFRRMFVAEARLAARIHHPNVVAVQDTEELDDELLLVMDYVEGATLATMRPLGRDARSRIRLAIRIVLDACAGLHAAHELRDENGVTLDIVHRDVSPQNVLVGVDGMTRLTDFGIAKSKAHTMAPTVTGGLKGKLGYMAPEYVSSGIVDRRGDVFALGVVLWESLTESRLFKGTIEVEVMNLMARCEIESPSSATPEIPAAIDDVVLRALAKERGDRFPSTRALAEALEEAARPLGLVATHAEVAEAVERAAGETLERRRLLLSDSKEHGEVPTEPRVEIADHTRTQTLDPALHTAGGQTVSAGEALARPSGVPRQPLADKRLTIGATAGALVFVLIIAAVVASRTRTPPAAVAGSDDPSLDVDEAGSGAAALPTEEPSTRPDASAPRAAKSPNRPAPKPPPPKPPEVAPTPGRAPPNPYRPKP